MHNTHNFDDVKPRLRTGSAIQSDGNRRVQLRLGRNNCVPSANPRPRGAPRARAPSPSPSPSPSPFPFPFPVPVPFPSSSLPLFPSSPLPRFPKAMTGWTRMWANAQDEAEPKLTQENRTRTEDTRCMTRTTSHDCELEARFRAKETNAFKCV